MLRYKTQTRPGLVALYDIWPGNGAGLFLQPRNPHGVPLQLQHNKHQLLTLLLLLHCKQNWTFCSD